MAGTKIAFLYSEIAGYFLACAKEAAQANEVLIVRWPVNAEAPFKFDETASIRIEDRSNYDEEGLKKLLNDFQPDILVVSGWMDKGYLKVARSFKKKIPVVLSLDNHWTGSLKQRLACLLSPFYLKKIYTHAWVPGKVQKEFADRLGFKGKVKLDYYCADTSLFEGIYQDTFPAKRTALPKRFLYVARYVEHKGIFEMWNAFLELQKEEPNDWEIWCLGTGDEWDNRIEGDKIKHVGFVQPDEMSSYIAQTSVYILPSKFEPWGVTVQEFAVCGMPLLISSAIGSGEKYLSDNGFVFEAGSKDAIKEAMKKTIAMSDEEILKMGERSHELGMSFTPKDWVQNLLSFKQ